MKVNINITVDIDPQAWKLEFGPTVPIREDVKTYFQSMINWQIADLDVANSERSPSTPPQS